MTAGVCVPCAVGYYQDVPGSIECTKCPANRLSPSTGAVSVSECVSPAPNFSFGFIALAVCAMITLTHMILGRYHDIAFQRKERIVKGMAKISLDTNRKIKDLLKYQCLQDYKKSISQQVNISTDACIKN